MPFLGQALVWLAIFSVAGAAATLFISPSQDLAVRAFLTCALASVSLAIMEVRSVTRNLAKVLPALAGALIAGSFFAAIAASSDTHLPSWVALLQVGLILALVAVAVWSSLRHRQIRLRDDVSSQDV